MAPETRANVKPVQTQPGPAFFWWMTVASIGFCAMIATLSIPQFLGGTIKAGDLAGRDIIADRTIDVEVELATRKAREHARQMVLPVFKRDLAVEESVLKNLRGQLALVGSLQSAAQLPLSGALALTAEEQEYLIKCSDAAWQRIKSSCALPHGSQFRRTDSSRTSDNVSNQTTQANERAGLEETIATKLRQHIPQLSRQRTGAADPLSFIERARQAYRSSGIGNNSDLLFLAVSVKPDSWKDMSATIEQATRKMLKLGHLFSDIPNADRERIMLEFLPDRWPDTIRFTSAKVAASVLKPNMVVDSEATGKKADSAAESVPPVLKHFNAGEVIVPKGSIISAESASLLHQLGITRSTDWTLVLSLTLSLMAACTLFGLFLHSYAPKHLYSPSSIGLLFTISVVACGVSAFVGESFPQFVPIPAAALICAVFFGPRVAAALIILLLIFLKVDNLVDTNNIIALATASVIAIGANIKQRHELMFRGFLIGVMQAVGFLCAVIVFHASMSAGALGQQLLLQILGGLSSCIVAIGSLPFLEDLFGMVTPFRITELTASDQPLLRRLEENAPGTYQHSLAVANLAEAGARAIGGDVTLVRAGSLYHDIGKMVRPKYFIENQLGDTNPHDAMSPEESRDRVLAHVTDGMALAQKFGLPRVVQDFIPQHQGTTLMAYFYHKACLRDGAENVDAPFYRYPGPKPQSKEAAIVMLADVSEAVTHSMNDPTQEEVEASMSTVFKARWDDGQFSESGLSKDELEKVKKAFVRVWRTLHHERLKYPSTTTGRMPVAPEHPPKTPTVSQSSQQVQE